MKAIVLTYDRNEALAGHMISCYEELWPHHPFTFRVPYQNPARCTPHERTEYIQSGPGIKSTVLTLLSGLDDEEWIYWCIDDKYPVSLRLEAIEPIYHAIHDGGLSDISGILFCRARRMLDPAFLDEEELEFGREVLLGRKAYQQIWIHQFLRVKVLRFMFESFPDVIEQAEVMDGMKDQLVKPAGHRLYVTSVNHAVFGESSFRGVITSNCLASLKAKGLAIPAWQPEIPSEMSIFGEL